MKRSVKVALSLAFLGLAASVSACSVEEDDGPEFSRACVNDEEIRTEDQPCDEGRSGHRWWYVHHSHPVPAVGSKVNTGLGSYSKPGGSVGSVSRGGFGGRAAAGS